MITKLLNLCGLALGNAQKLISGQAGQAGENADGFWEHYDFYSLNERLLISLGAGWDQPELEEGWEYSDKAAPFISEARYLLEKMRVETGNGPVWGWKDPRNSITLPFWKNLIPDLKVVVCLRDPIEVAQSLQKRNNLSFAASEKLWNKYYESILLNTTPQTRIVSHYAAYFQDASAELKRLINWANLPADENTINLAIPGSRIELRHHTRAPEDIDKANFSNYTLELYAYLCKEADHSPTLLSNHGATMHSHLPSQGSNGVPVEFLKPQVLRTEVQKLKDKVSSQDEVIQTLTNRLNEQNEILTALLDKQAKSLSEQVEIISDKVRKTSSAVEQIKIQLKRMPGLLAAQKQHAEMISSLMPGIERAIALHGAYTQAYRHYDYLTARLEAPLTHAQSKRFVWLARSKVLSLFLSTTRHLKWMPQIFSWQRQLHQIEGELGGTLAHISYTLAQPRETEKSTLGLEKDFGQKTHVDVSGLMTLLRERLAWQNTDTSE